MEIPGTDCKHFKQQDISRRTDSKGEPIVIMDNAITNKLFHNTVQKLQLNKVLL